MDDIILIGGGGHCKSCIDVIELEGRYRIAGIVDMPEKIGHEVCGYPIVASDGEIFNLTRKYNNFLVTLGQIKSPENRIGFFKLLESYGVNLPFIISPIAYVSKHALVGKGTVIFHHAIVNTKAKIGKNCIINTKSLVEHDVIVGDHCHISTGVVINGGAKIGDGSFIGSGSVCVQDSRIAKSSFIKANNLIK